jgi:hypothetical protein
MQSRETLRALVIVAVVLAAPILSVLWASSTLIG